MGSLTPNKISFICFLDLFAASLIVPLMNNYLRSEIQLSNLFIGMIGSIFSLLQIISAPTVGYSSDLLGRKNILLLCLLVCALSYFLLGMFKNVLVIILVRILLGLFKHTQVLCKAYISDICTDSTAAYSQLMMVTFLGFFIGPALGGHLITYEDGFLYICCLASSVFVLTFLYAFVMVYDVEGEVAREGKEVETQDVSPLEDGSSVLRGDECVDDNLKSRSSKTKNTSDVTSNRTSKTSNKTGTSKQPPLKSDKCVDDQLKSRSSNAKITSDATSNRPSKTSNKKGTSRQPPLKSDEGVAGQLKSRSSKAKITSVATSNPPSKSSNKTGTFIQPPKPSEIIEAEYLFSKTNLISYWKETFNIDWSLYWGIFLIKFLYALSMSLFYSNYISVLTHHFEVSSQITGYTVSLQGLIGSFSNFFIHVKHKHSHASLHLSFLLLSLSIYCLYKCSNLYLFVILLIPLSISSSLIRVLCLNITMKSSDSSRKGNISGIYNSLTSIAKVITPILGGVVSDWVQDNYKVTFLVSFVFAMIGALLSGLVMFLSTREIREKRD